MDPILVTGEYPNIKHEIVKERPPKFTEKEIKMVAYGHMGVIAIVETKNFTEANKCKPFYHYDHPLAAKKKYMGKDTAENADFCYKTFGTK